MNAKSIASSDHDGHNINNNSNNNSSSNNNHFTNNRQSFNSSDDVIVTERHYGCYKLGAIVAIVIIVILLIGTIPILLTIKDRRIVLIIIASVLSVVCILVGLTLWWQHRIARLQRQHFGRDTLRNHRAIYKSVPTTTTQPPSPLPPSTRTTHHTSWSFWSTQKSTERGKINEIRTEV